MNKRELAEHVINYIETAYWKTKERYPNMRDATVFEKVIDEAKAIVKKEATHDSQTT
jgi:hypothetical protein